MYTFVKFDERFLFRFRHLSYFPLNSIHSIVRMMSTLILYPRVHIRVYIYIYISIRGKMRDKRLNQLTIMWHEKSLFPVIRFPPIASNIIFLVIYIYICMCVCIVFFSGKRTSYAARLIRPIIYGGRRVCRTWLGYYRIPVK